MAVPKQKQSHARTSKRRSQHKVQATGYNLCPQCHSPRLPHRVCPECEATVRPYRASQRWCSYACRQGAYIERRNAAAVAARVGMGTGGAP